jgi:hypothetical protein
MTTLKKGYSDLLKELAIQATRVGIRKAELPELTLLTFDLHVRERAATSRHFGTVI